MKKSVFIFIIISLILFVLLIVFPQTAMDAAKRGLDLWFSIVFPSLLPFFIGSYILLETQVLNVLSIFLAPVTKFLFGCSGHGGYVYIASAFSGYPMGAKLTAQLYENKTITKSEAQRIVNLSSVTGPVFIYGAIAAGLLGQPEVGIYIALPHYLSAILAAVMFRVFSKEKIVIAPADTRSVKTALHHIIFKNRLYQSDIGNILLKAITSAVATLLLLLGFMMLFSVIISLLDKIKIVDVYRFLYSPLFGAAGLSPAAAKAFFSGFFEMTAGVNAAAALDTDITAKAVICSGIVSYGGLCIHAQTYAICAKSKFKPKGFLLFKSLQAGLASLMTFCMLRAVPLCVQTSNIIKSFHTAGSYRYAGSAFLALSLVLLIYLRVHKRVRLF